MVEVNSETDFVARNDLFQGLVKMIADVALDVGTDVEKIKAAKAGGLTVAESIAETDRQDRREHDAAPRRRTVGRQGRGRRAMCTTRCPTVSARWACWSALESTGKADELAALGRQLAPCTSPPPIRRRSIRGARSGRGRARERRARRKGQGAGQARERHRQDRRSRASRPSTRRSACSIRRYHPRGQEERRASAQGGRGQGRRRRSRSQASCATAGRRHRKAGSRFRRRSRGGLRRQETR